MRKRMKKYIGAVLGAAYTLILTTPIKAYAKNSDVSEVTDGIDVLTDLVLACVGGVGVIFLAWGLLDFGTAYSAHDTTQQSAAIKKVVGGLIMIAVPTLLKLLGAT